MQLISEQRLFEGRQIQYRHASEACHCDMVFSVYLPPQAASGPVPVMYWLSGLTCDDQNFSAKSGAQRYAAESGLAIVIPDTSPRGNDVPDDPDGGWDFGLSAGFYVNATQVPWDRHYRMYDYITHELRQLVEKELPLDGDRRVISGHSMGGHGALVIGLRNPDLYQSISAFSPIVAPSEVPWGHKALGNYLGDDKTAWLEYDATELLTNTPEHAPILVDQGEADNFLEEQLQTWRMQAVASENTNIRMQAGYDHSYYFVSSFIGEHVQFHMNNI